MNEYFNVDNIMISNDEIIGEIFRHSTINSALYKTNHMLDISKKISNLCEDYFYKISINLAAFAMIDNNDDMKVDITFKKNCLLVYSVIVNYLSKTEILTEEEMGEDIKDIQNINDSQFYNDLNHLLMEFAISFDMLNNNFYHA